MLYPSSENRKKKFLENNKVAGPNTENGIILVFVIPFMTTGSKNTVSADGRKGELIFTENKRKAKCIFKEARVRAIMERSRKGK